MAEIIEVEPYVARTIEMLDFINDPDEHQDIDKGATMLLQANRNKILYDNIIRSHLTDKLIYELNKQIDYRCARLAISREDLTNSKIENLVEDSYPSMEVKAIAIVSRDQQECNNIGKREDHDNLPPEIQDLLLQNVEIYKKIKDNHEQLKLLIDARNCDRYPFVKEIIKLDKVLTSNYKKYDEFNSLTDSNPDATADKAREINSARNFLSKYKQKLRELIESEDTEQAEELRAKFNERIKGLKDYAIELSPDNIAELKYLGCNV